MDFNEWIQRSLLPKLTRTEYYPAIDPLKATVTFIPAAQIPTGDILTLRHSTAYSSNGGALVKGQGNPAPATQTLTKPYWTKLFYDDATSIEGIDKSNNRGGDFDMAREAITTMTRNLMGNIVLPAQYTSMKSDIDATGAYSDKGLSRTTHPTYASYEEATDTPITLPLWRGMVDGTRLNKNTNPKSNYIALTEERVYNKVRPLMAALHTYDKANEGLQALGYPDAASFEGTDIAVPDNMTKGDILYFDRTKAYMFEHMPLEIEQVESGAFTAEFVGRVGLNTVIDDPGKAGKMTDKD